MNLLPLEPRSANPIKRLLATWMVRSSFDAKAIRADWNRADTRVPPNATETSCYNDSFVFQGTSEGGDLFMSRLGFREDGSLAEIWVMVELEGVLHVNRTTELTVPVGDTVQAGGLSYTYDNNTGTWHIDYKGDLGNASADIALTYTPATEPYLSSAHMDPASTGAAMAQMPWSRSYFEKLRSERQVRYEQGGWLEGIISVGDTRKPVRMHAFRDHSWGRRDWTFLNRYIWNILSLREPLVLRAGKITHLCYTTVDYGSSFKHLVSGWVAGSELILPIVAAANMHALAGDGTIPQEYKVAFLPKGEKVIEGEVRRSPFNHSWMLQGETFEVNEARCEVTIDGIPGQGMSEFGFSDRCGIPRPVFAGGK